MKLAEIRSQAVHPTSLEGVFVRDLSMEKLEELGKLGEGEENMDALLWLFQNLICDQEGELFEDVQSQEDIKKAGMMTIKAVTEAATEALQQGGK